MINFNNTGGQNDLVRHLPLQSIEYPLLVWRRSSQVPIVVIDSLANVRRGTGRCRPLIITQRTRCSIQQITSRGRAKFAGSANLKEISNAWEERGLVVSSAARYSMLTGRLTRQGEVRSNCQMPAALWSTRQWREVNWTALLWLHQFRVDSERRVRYRPM